MKKSEIASKPEKKVSKKLKLKKEIIRELTDTEAGDVKGGATILNRPTMRCMISGNASASNTGIITSGCQTYSG